ncbi:MAG: hypothetical protein WAQ05_14390 [Rubrivivax sp.]
MTMANDNSVPVAGNLSDEEIHAILEREASALPPEAHLQPPPIALATRQPGQGRHGWLVVALMVAFVLVSMWQSTR